MQILKRSERGMSGVFFTIRFHRYSMQTIHYLCNELRFAFIYCETKILTINTYLHVLYVEKTTRVNAYLRKVFCCGFLSSTIPGEYMLISGFINYTMASHRSNIHFTAYLNPF